MARTKKADTKKDAVKATDKTPETPGQTEGTTPAPETAEQTEGTTPAPETAEQAEGTTTAPETAEQAEGTTTAPETAEQAEGTTTAPETAEQAEGTTTAPETEEQTEGTDPAPETPEQDLFVGIQNPCVYCGPTVRGVARQYTTYQGGIPDTLRDFIKEHPDARQLIVSTAQFPAYRRRLDTPGTEEAKLYKRVKEQL